MSESVFNVCKICLTENQPLSGAFPAKGKRSPFGNSRCPSPLLSLPVRQKLRRGTFQHPTARIQDRIGCALHRTTVKKKRKQYNKSQKRERERDCRQNSEEYCVSYYSVWSLLSINKNATKWEMESTDNNCEKVLHLFFFSFLISILCSWNLWILWNLRKRGFQKCFYF